jgi:hypothetical protein
LDSYINIDKKLEINPSINAPLKEKQTRFAMFKKLMNSSKKLAKIVDCTLEKQIFQNIHQNFI